MGEESREEGLHFSVFPKSGGWAAESGRSRGSVMGKGMGGAEPYWRPSPNRISSPPNESRHHPCETSKNVTPGWDLQDGKRGERVGAEVQVLGIQDPVTGVVQTLAKCPCQVGT